MLRSDARYVGDSSSAVLSGDALGESLVAAAARLRHHRTRRETRVMGRGGGRLYG